jgi:phenylpropionate dioxygenase-like ring-hydroxylating dioxygenase large terminal subunit
VTCPYHGWEFNGGGHCIHIPSLGEDQHPPARAKVDTYPTEERYGILFAFLGDLPEAERPPIYDITEFDHPDWRANRLVVFEVDYYYERSVENGLDPAHNEFVHPKQGATGAANSLSPSFTRKRTRPCWQARSSVMWNICGAARDTWALTSW